MLKIFVYKSKPVFSIDFDLALLQEILTVFACKQLNLRSAYPESG